jgi:hypothetical protein
MLNAWRLSRLQLIASVVLNRSVNLVRGNRELAFRNNDVSRSGIVVVDILVRQLLRHWSSEFVLEDKSHFVLT